jgi:hypothetical protein
MARTTQNRPAPYGLVPPGFEAVFTGEKSCPSIEATEMITTRVTDDAGNVMVRWPVFPWTFPGQEKDWDDEIRHINEMQAGIGPLDVG